ncbi:MAG: hypothetical protein IKE69_08065 [Thermoguttaceae bacterium]|nr:hypothetical protein [Thermoguttaceae bacterium]
MKRRKLTAAEARRLEEATERFNRPAREALKEAFFAGKPLAEAVRIALQAHAAAHPGRGGARPGSGRPPLPPGAKKRRLTGFTAQFPPELLERAKTVSAERGMSVSALLVEALRTYLD